MDNKPLQEQITDLQNQVKKLTEIISKNDFSQKTYITKQLVLSPEASIVLQSDGVNAAKISFMDSSGNVIDAGGIFGETLLDGSGYSKVSWKHATGEVGIRIYGQEVGGGGRAVEFFVGSDYFRIVDGDGGGNIIETSLAKPAGW